jgi:hypothetical protein
MPPFIPNAPNDSVFGSPIQTNSLSATGQETIPGAPPQVPVNDPYADDKRLIELFEKLKKESFENRWVWEKDWLQENLYVGNRQWIAYHPNRREWVDKRLQKWIPRPVTNKMAETLQAIRTNLAAIELSVKARPIGNDTQSVAAAEIADQMAPLIHEEHDMNQVMRESDYWLIVNGSALLQISWDLDSRFNKTFIQNEQCLQCGNVNTPKDIKAAGDICPICGGNQFTLAVNPQDGTKVGEWVSFGKGKTTALSPFEWAFPQDCTRFDELPYIIRMRWREKHWFEANMPELVSKIQFEKSSSDRSLQLYKSLSTSNSGGTIGTSALSATTSNQIEGITEYELWLKPTPDFPEGLVLRMIGEKAPIVLRMPQETLPGPFPYKDIEGKPLFPFVFSQYEQMGGKLYGRSALNPLLQKQDQLNQLDSLTQLIVQRMANPIWVVPEGAGIDHFTGEPGLVMKWNPLSSGGNAKPERVAGSEIPASLSQMRDQIIRDIEELSGAFDIIKGEKPQGIEAFSALQLLVERSQSRFASVFQARGEMYRRWFAISLELERQFGPDTRVWSVVGPNRGYTFKHFQNAQLQGQVSIQIEDGSNMPKTALGKRAAVEQASQMMLLDPADPDQKYALLTTFGLTDLVPALNIHVQAALQIQDAFEKWAEAPMGLSPLVVKPWFDPQVHWTERIKWLNGDKMRELLAMNPGLEPIIIQHLSELQMILSALAQPTQDPNAPPGQGGQQKTGGGGQAMTNSNTNSGSTQGARPSPSKKETGPNQGNR